MAPDFDFSLSFYSTVLAIYSSSILLHSLCSFKLFVYFFLNSLFEHNLVSKLKIVEVNNTAKKYIICQLKWNEQYFFVKRLF